jgi:hypothetical protein
MSDMEVVPPKNDWRVVIHQALRVGDDLDSEFRRHAELMGKAAYYSAMAKKRVRRLKSELELLSAQLRKSIRKRLSSLTVDEMKAAVVRKKRYQQKIHELEEAQYHEDLVSGILTALQYKKDCMVQISANSRKELPEELRALSESLKRRFRIGGHSG